MKRAKPGSGLVQTCVFGALATLAIVLAGGAEAAEKASQQVSPFYGSFSYSIPIEVPPFHGLEPRLALAYSSEGRNGIVGVGWSLTGFSTIERANSGRGTPRFDASDIYLLDGQELVACAGGSVSPSCTSGGTHSTKIESYLKIRFDAPSNTWTVWGKDGTRTVFSPLMTASGGVFRWGQTSVIDTKNNTVTYNWNCTVGDCYPLEVQYNGYRVTLFLESRPDPQSAAAYSSLITTQMRIRSVLVWLPGVSNIRAYKLSYTASPLTSRSLLSSVQQYGKNVTFDGSSPGLINGGTSLPAQNFSYQDDTLGDHGRTFQGQMPDPLTPPGTLENVVWANRVATWAVEPGNSLQKSIGTNAWDAGGSSTRAIASGDGYMEITASGWDMVVGLANGDIDATPADVDFGIFATSSYILYAYENGVMYGPFGSYALGDKLRVDVQGGVVRYKKAGVTFYTSTRPPTFPLRVDSSIYTGWATISSAVVSGALQDANFWCQGALLLTGDFNADGRTDQLCHRSETLTTQVRLGTVTGFAPATTWLTGASFSQPRVGDFNADGKADLVDGPDWDGNFYALTSTGSAFNPSALWGNATGSGIDGSSGQPLYGSCRMTGTISGTGDFNGDGITDVSCRVAGDGKIFIGLSDGAAHFNFSIFASLACEAYEQTGAIDFDGDGKDDWYCIGMTNNAMLVFPSTGSTFAYPAFGYLDGWFCDQPSYVLGDFNADGRTDAACLTNGKVALSTGHAFLTQTAVGGWCPNRTNAFAADVDGDGASEIVCNASGGDIQVRKWQAGALGTVETWKSGWCSTSIGAGDFNGDGKTDLFCNSQAVPVAVAGTKGLQVDLVSVVANGLGGTIGTAYSPATVYPDTNVSKQVVASVSTNDGRTGAVTSTTDYSYSGGRMDPKERRFLGFSYVKQTFPHATGETPPYTETWLRQDLASAGRPERVEHHSASGILRRKEEYVYTAPASPLPLTSLLTEQWNYDYDGSGTPSCPTWPCAVGKRTRTTYLYDAYGNRTQSIFFIDPDDTHAEKLRTVLSFWPNTSAYITGAVARQQKFKDPFEAASVSLSDDVFWYDGSNNWAQPPSQGFTTASFQWLDTESIWVGTLYGYDAFGNQTTVTDAQQRTTTTAYDASYHVFPTSVTNPANEAETTTWDPVCSLPSQRTDANNQVATMLSDALCRPTQTTLPLGGFETRSYVSFGNPNAQHVRVETPSSVAGFNLYAKQYFDGLGRTYQTARKGPAIADILQSTVYNSRGLVGSQTAPYYSGSASFATTYGYDSLNRLGSTQTPDGYSTTHTYPAWRDSFTDEHGHVVTAAFDAFGRKVLTERHLGGNNVQTQYGYDMLGRMTGMTDHLGNHWSWTFDSMGRNIAKSDPDAGGWTYHYDYTGLLTSQADAMSPPQTTTFTYDAAGRPATQTTYAGTFTVTRGEARAGYYNAGRVTTVTASSSPPKTRTMDYDALGRMVKQTSTLDGVTYVAQKQYGTGGFLQTLTYPDGDSVGPMAYDAAGRLNVIPGLVTSVAYDAAGRATVQANANGTTTSKTFTAQRGFLTAISTSGPSGTLQNLGYTPDPTGMVTQVTSPFTNESWSYTYDDLHRLTAATGSQNQTFQYDDIGRITYNSLVGTYSYGTSRPHAPTAIAGNAMTYDANGNLLTGQGRTITWNSRNLPSQINSTQFNYDALGNRYKKLTGSSTSLYPMGDDYEITNGVVTKYVSVDGLGVLAKRVGAGGGATTFWLHSDRLGSIQAITNSSGAEIQRRTYRPYGDKIADTTGLVESRGYIGERQDSETGLTYLHARFYDPALGIFVSPDPVHPARPGVGFNRYVYSLDDPINGLDPSGLSQRKCIADPKSWNERDGYSYGPPACVGFNAPTPDPVGTTPGSSPHGPNGGHEGRGNDGRGGSGNDPDDGNNGNGNAGNNGNGNADVPACGGHGAQQCRAHDPIDSDHANWTMSSMELASRGYLAASFLKSLVEFTPLIVGAAIHGGGDSSNFEKADVEEALSSLEAGSSERIRLVGSEAELEQLFGRISQGATPIGETTYPGRFLELSDGTTVGLRPTSQSGGPTIDIVFPDGGVHKVHIKP